MLPLLLAGLSAPPAPPLLTGATGYYRMPTLAGDTLVFVSEGDLWRVDVRGGLAARLTSHPGDETTPALSPDGRFVAFVGQYEGPSAVYTMPSTGGLPTRWTWDGGRVAVVGWTPSGKVLYTDTADATLPDPQLYTLDPKSGVRERLPLAQASDGAYDEAEKDLYFTRLPFQGSYTKRYRGGDVQQLWKYAKGAKEAVPLTADFDGTSTRPLVAGGRVYFVSDRDGTMNLWSMSTEGGGLQQLTHSAGWDVSSPSLSQGRIAYRVGADIHLLDLATTEDHVVPISLNSDLDQTRERWIPSPVDYLTSWNVSPTGDRLALTARGQVFVAPRKDGRFVRVTHGDGVRYRAADFAPDGQSLVALSDASGEVELTDLPANGVGEPVPLTHDSVVLRWNAVPSPDGRWVASANKNQELWLYDRTSKATTRIAKSEADMLTGLTWSPDGRWLAYVATAANQYAQIWLYDTQGKTTTAATTDRFDSYSPAWSPDGAWLYFLSERNLHTTVKATWGALDPQPYFDHRVAIYALALHTGARSPFAPADELHPATPAAPPTDGPPEKTGDKTGDKAADKTGKTKAKADTSVGTPPKAPPVTIDLDGLPTRLWPVPAPPGNLAALTVNGAALFYTDRDDAPDAKPALLALAIGNDHPTPVTVLGALTDYQLTDDGKRLAIRTDAGFFVVDAGAGPASLDKAAVDLSGWSLSVTPQVEWRQMFTEAWRLERDYFYDTNMHGVDWDGMRKKYLPLVDRVRTRAELSDLIGQMVGELSALHTFVSGGDLRAGPEKVGVATLGARMEITRAGWKIAHIYASDPDAPERRSPLLAPGVDVPEGSVILAVDGVSTLSVPDPAALLRTKAGRQVLLHLQRPDGKEADAIVTAIPAATDADLRYLDWEYSRRQVVEEEGKGHIGYVHLRAMGGSDYDDFARGFYPVFTRDGLIVDVRHNRGGNIDSWILSRLQRKVWMYWSQRVGAQPSWNMQHAFRGHIVVLCDQATASDGEAFTEGFRRLGLGHVIGMRTWGGEIWLSADNFLVDNGIATAAEYGVYGPEGAWLIEGHGAEPDEVVDNLPVATFRGEDAQLAAAIRWLQKKIADEPVPPPPQPPYPDKSGSPAPR